MRRNAARVNGLRGSGWHKEPWRHSLAAKGIRTGKSTPPARANQLRAYFQPQGPDFVIQTDLPGDERLEQSQQKQKQRQGKQSSDKGERGLSPQTVLKQLQAERLIEAELERQRKASKPGTQALQSLRAGDFTQLESSLAAPEAQITAAEKQAIRAEANRQAVQLAQAGFDIPESVEDVLTGTTKTQIQAIKKEQERQSRPALEQTLRGIGREALVGAESKIRRTEGEVLEEQAREKRKIERARETLDEGVAPFPFVSLGDNIFLGDGENGLGKEGTDGTFDFLSDPTQKTTPLSSSIVPREKLAPIDFGLGERQKSFSEKLADEVESMWSSRKELGRVDTSPLEKGEKAFKQGNREKLIEAINEQEFQVKQQESRWKLVEQTRQLVESQQNRQSIFNDTSSSPFSFSMFSSGADKIADETKKINVVKKEIKQGADEARARAANLRGKLQRLDTQVPPEDSLPKERVDVFKQSKWTDILSLPNPGNVLPDSALPQKRTEMLDE